MKGKQPVYSPHSSYGTHCTPSTTPSRTKVGRFRSERNSISSSAPSHLRRNSTSHRSASLIDSDSSSSTDFLPYHVNMEPNPTTPLLSSSNQSRRKPNNSARNSLSNPSQRRSSISSSHTQTSYSQRSRLSAVPQPQRNRTTRLLSLDLFRGLTVCLMIIANYQFEKHAFPHLVHAKWIGLTVADVIFPTFLFILGAVGITLPSFLDRIKCILKVGRPSGGKRSQ